MPFTAPKTVQQFNNSSTSETGKQKAAGPTYGIYWHPQQVTESLKRNPLI